MNADTAYSVSASRQFCGSNGTLSEPRVKTAANRSVRQTPPTTSCRRCFDSSLLIAASPSTESGQFSSGEASYAGTPLECGRPAPCTQDNHAVRACQEIRLYSRWAGLFHRTGISHFRTMREIPPPPSLAFAKVSLGVFRQESYGCPSVWARF